MGSQLDSVRFTRDAILARLDSLLRRASPASLFTGLGAAAVVKNGWAVDELGRIFSSELVPALPHLPAWAPLYHFLFSSPIGAVLARLLGVRTFGWFVLLHLSFLVIGLGLIELRISRLLGSVHAKVLMVAFTASAVPVALLQRVGGYDVFTVVLGGLAATCISGVSGGTVGFFLAFSSFEQGSIALVAVMLVRRLGGEPWRPMLPTIAGLVTGRLVLGLWLEWAGAQGSRLDWIRHFGVGMFVRMFFQGLPLFLLTATGSTAVLVGVAARGLEREARRTLWLQCTVACLVPLAATVLVDDQTRVFSLVWWPPAVALLMSLGRQVGGDRMLRASVWCLSAWLIVPPVLVSHGTPFLARHHLVRFLIGG